MIQTDNTRNIIMLSLVIGLAKQPKYHIRLKIYIQPTYVQGYKK